MERETTFTSYVNSEALELYERSWEESSAFFRNFKIEEKLGLEGFQTLIFEACFAECLVQKRGSEESSYYPILRLIPQRFRPSQGIFQKTTALLHLNTLEYVENYQESLGIMNKEEKITPREIVLAAHLLSSVYLENLSKGRQILEKSISAAIERVPFKKKAAQE